MSETLDAYASVLVFLAVIPATAFPILYGFRSAWWIHPIGRALMTKAIGMALLIDITVIYALFGDEYPGRHLVRAIVYTLIVAGLYYQTAVLISIQRAARRNPKKGKPL